MNIEVFSQRRTQFFQQLGKASAILFAAPSQVRNDDNSFPYRTCSFFYYLTGCREPNAAAIFSASSKAPFQLFVQPKDSMAEVWNGRRLGVDLAKDVYGADACYSIELWEEKFKQTLPHTEELFLLMGIHRKQENHVLDILRNHFPNRKNGEREVVAIRKLQSILSPMRMVKDSGELALMRENCTNSARAHAKAMAATRPGLFEYQIAAEIEFQFKYQGASDLAYPSIVAGGENALILHYVDNKDVLRDGDLLLIDAGGERGLYASDITRTFPVNGKFSPAQRQLYEIVLQSQKAAIQAVRPGARFHDAHDAALRVLLEGLLRLKILTGSVEELMKDRKSYGAFYPHGTSHWLGLDVHDAGATYQRSGESVILVPGNVLTVEPGLYMPTDDARVPAEFRGIGIRIEDDVLVTESGREVLTEGVPKEIAAIEALVGSGSVKI